jgi:hypothetical protein
LLIRRPPPLLLQTKAMTSSPFPTSTSLGPQFSLKWTSSWHRPSKEYESDCHLRTSNKALVIRLFVLGNPLPFWGKKTRHRYCV